MNATKTPSTVISGDGVFVVTHTENAVGLQVSSMPSGRTLAISDAAVGSLYAENGMAIAEGDKVDYAVDSTRDDAVMVHSVLEDRSAPERHAYQFSGVDWIMIDEQTGMAILFQIASDGIHAVGGVRPLGSGCERPTSTHSFRNCP
ncbi:hypothetical protein [Bifidobacterium italicum]|uniref:hypothetical protein n=1 Tax=Bifidobacterium italicum TaxID=1960968 RepID=UPI0013900736|nr:hypothetical protein [Bifidobacterium italicum]